MTLQKRQKFILKNYIFKNLKEFSVKSTELEAYINNTLLIRYFSITDIEQIKKN